MYHLLTAIWNIITHKDDSECFQVSCYWHFTVEAMPQTTSVLPRKGSFLPRAWLTCVLSSKVRESSRKPIQMAPGSLQSCMKLVPRPCHGKSQCILIHTLTLEIPMGLEPDGLCVALFSFLNFFVSLHFVRWKPDYKPRNLIRPSIVSSCGWSPPWMAVGRPWPWWQVSCKVFQVDMIYACPFFLTVLWD